MSLLVWRLPAKAICTPLPHLAPDDPQPVLEQVDPGELDSLDALTQILPGGAYTTLRTFHGKQVLHLEDHFQRLERTAAMVEKSLYLHRSRARQAIQAALRLAQQWHYPPDGGEPSGEQDFRIRITLDLQDQPGDFYLALQPLTTPAHEAYQQGVSVVTFRMQRRLPKAKLTRFIERSGELRRAMPPGVNETMMLDEQGHFLEGLSSNFFAVLDGEIWTAEEGCYRGSLAAWCWRAFAGWVYRCACSLPTWRTCRASRRPLSLPPAARCCRSAGSMITRCPPPPVRSPAV